MKATATARSSDFCGRKPKINRAVAASCHTTTHPRTPRATQDTQANKRFK